MKGLGEVTCHIVSIDIVNAKVSRKFKNISNLAL